MATLAETVMGGETVSGLNGGLCTAGNVVKTGELTTVCDARSGSDTVEAEETVRVTAAAANFDMLSSRLLRTVFCSTSVPGCAMPKVRCFNFGDESGIKTPASGGCAVPKRCFAQSTRDVGDGTIFPLVVWMLEVETAGSGDCSVDLNVRTVSAAVVFDGSTAPICWILAFPVVVSTFVGTSASSVR